MDKTEYKIAVASSDGIVVNQHFGRADTFYIYEITQSGQFRLLETRNVTPVCKGGNHSEEELENNIAVLKGCRYIVVSRIGPGAARKVEQYGMTPVELPGMIKDSISKLITYEQIQQLF